MATEDKEIKSPEDYSYSNVMGKSPIGNFNNSLLEQEESEEILIPSKEEPKTNHKESNLEQDPQANDAMDQMLRNVGEDPNNYKGPVAINPNNDIPEDVDCYDGLSGLPHLDIPEFEEPQLEDGLNQESDNINSDKKSELKDDTTLPPKVPKKSSRLKKALVGTMLAGMLSVPLAVGVSQGYDYIFNKGYNQAKTELVADCNKRNSITEKAAWDSGYEEGIFATLAVGNNNLKTNDKYSRENLLKSAKGEKVISNEEKDDLSLMVNRLWKDEQTDITGWNKDRKKIRNYIDEVDADKNTLNIKFQNLPENKENLLARVTVDTNNSAKDGEIPANFNQGPADASIFSEINNDEASVTVEGYNFENPEDSLGYQVSLVKVNSAKVEGDSLEADIRYLAIDNSHYNIKRETKSKNVSKPKVKEEKVVVSQGEFQGASGSTVEEVIPVVGSTVKDSVPLPENTTPNVVIIDGSSPSSVREGDDEIANVISGSTYGEPQTEKGDTLSKNFGWIPEEQTGSTIGKVTPSDINEKNIEKAPKVEEYSLSAAYDLPNGELAIKLDPAKGKENDLRRNWDPLCGGSTCKDVYVIKSTEANTLEEKIYYLDKDTETRFVELNNGKNLFFVPADATVVEFTEKDVEDVDVLRLGTNNIVNNAFDVYVDGVKKDSRNLPKNLTSGQVIKIVPREDYKLMHDEVETSVTFTNGVKDKKLEYGKEYTIKEFGELNASYCADDPKCLQKDNNKDLESRVITGEKVNWNKVNKEWNRKEVATVVDVDTGLEYHVRRFGGSNHADVEPLTSKDAEIIVEDIYGSNFPPARYQRVGTSKRGSPIYKQVVSLDDGKTWVSAKTHGGENKAHLWTKRAALVSLDDGETWIDASTHGAPHGGSSIKDNDYPGHFCIHFYGSRNHFNGKTSPSAQRMVKKAANSHVVIHDNESRSYVANNNHDLMGPGYLTFSFSGHSRPESGEITIKIEPENSNINNSTTNSDVQDGNSVEQPNVLSGSSIDNTTPNKNNESNDNKNLEKSAKENGARIGALAQIYHFTSNYNTESPLVENHYDNNGAMGGKFSAYFGDDKNGVLGFNGGIERFKLQDFDHSNTKMDVENQEGGIFYANSFGQTKTDLYLEFLAQKSEMNPIKYYDTKLDPQEQTRLNYIMSLSCPELYNAENSSVGFDGGLVYTYNEFEQGDFKKDFDNYYFYLGPTFYTNGFLSGLYVGEQSKHLFESDKDIYGNNIGLLLSYTDPKENMARVYGEHNFNGDLEGDRLYGSIDFNLGDNTYGDPVYLSLFGGYSGASFEDVSKIKSDKSYIGVGIGNKEVRPIQIDTYFR